MLPRRGRIEPGTFDPTTDVYIGRGCPGHPPSPWSNPFKIGRGRDRNRAVQEFETFLLGSPALLRDLPALAGRTLRCHCPLELPCHGDVIVRIFADRCRAPLLSAPARARGVAPAAPLTDVAASAPHVFCTPTYVRGGSLSAAVVGPTAGRDPSAPVVGPTAGGGDREASARLELGARPPPVGTGSLPRPRAETVSRRAAASQGDASCCDGASPGEGSLCEGSVASSGARSTVRGLRARRNGSRRGEGSMAASLRDRQCAAFGRGARYVRSPVRPRGCSESSARLCVRSGPGGHDGCRTRSPARLRARSGRRRTTPRHIRTPVRQRTRSGPRRSIGGASEHRGTLDTASRARRRHRAASPETLTPARWAERRRGGRDQSRARDQEPALQDGPAAPPTATGSTASLGVAKDSQSGLRVAPSRPRRARGISSRSEVSRAPRGRGVRSESHPPRAAAHARAAAFFDRVVLELPPPAAADARAADTITFFELFAGHGGLSAAAEVLGCDVVPVDWFGNQHEQRLPVVPIDLATPGGQETVYQMIVGMRARFVWSAPPCGTFSRARDRPLPREAREAGVRRPPPLRSDEHVGGLPGLSGDDALRVQTGNALADFSAAAARFCLKHNIFFAIENPDSSRLWQMPSVRRLLNVAGVIEVRLHHCRFGGRRPKHTRLVTNMASLARLALKCQGDHEHAPWASWDEHGAWKFHTAEEAEYPEGLCRAVAAAVVDHLAGDAALAEPIADTFARLRARPGRRGRTRRGHPDDLLSAAGRQPRGNRPPLIPERPPRSEEKGESAAGRPGGDAVDDDVPEEWSPQGFLDAAAAAPHPIDVRFDPPDEMRNVIRGWVREPRLDAVSALADEIAFWRGRARDLEEDEAALHEMLPEANRRVLQGKRLLLLQEMAEVAGHPDPTIVHEIAGGFTLAGDVPASGTFPTRGPHDAVIGESLAWLDARARAVQEELLAGLRRRPLEPAIAAGVAKATDAEIAAGWVEGPFTEAELTAKLGPLWVPARRFGVQQGAKLRPIDDLSRSLVNAAVSVEDLVVPTGVDCAVTVARAWVEEIRDAGADPADEAWRLGGRTLDLEAAYKQCAVRRDHVRFAAFAFEAPAAPGGAYVYVASALPFGGVTSVVHFNRTARLLQQVLLRVFGLPIFHYVDDFPLIGPAALWEVFTTAVTEVMALLGWRWKQASLDKDFDHAFDLLGVRLDLAAATEHGDITVMNTAKRLDELGATIAAVVAAGALEPHAAAALAGRLMFAAAQCFGKSGSAFLAPVRAAARRRGPAKVAGELAAALAWWGAFLGAAAPRRLRAIAPDEPVLVFVDGCCEPRFHGVGAMVWDRASGTAECFGLEVWPQVSADLCRLAASGQIIAQLELLPCLLALWLWGRLFASPGRRCIVFIDNDSARHALIRGYSPARASRPIVDAFWAAAARLQSASWFARVSTHGNPADAPSRLRFTEAAGLRPAFRRVAPPDGEDRLRSILNGGGVGRAVGPPRPGTDAHIPI